jgi:hypothetical protein
MLRSTRVITDNGPPLSALVEAYAGFADDFLIRERAIGFGGIKKRHAKLEGLAGEGRISSLGSPQH